MHKCCLCGNTRFRFFKKFNKHTLLRCYRCDLVQVDNPHYAGRAKENSEIYNKNYINSYASRKTELQHRFKFHLDQIYKYKNKGNLLDIGCGIGYFLQVVESSSKKWKTCGVEINPGLARISDKNIEGKVKVGSMNKLSFKDSVFDVITCLDVLEHDENLNLNLKSIYRVLKPGGIFLVQCPNYQSLMQAITKERWDWWAVPDHLLHFTPATLRQALVRNKFRILKEITYNSDKDFIENIKGLYKNRTYKAICLLFSPILKLMNKFARFLGYGALQLVIVSK